MRTRSTLSCLITLGALLAFPPVQADAQNVTPEEVVNLTPALSKTGFNPGETFQAAVVVEIMAGYHLYAHGTSDPALIPTALRLPEDSPVSWPFVRYPEDYQRPGEDVPGLVGEEYYDRIIIRLVGRLPADAALGELTVPMGLFYQTCTDQICLMPVTKPFSFTIPVVAPGTAVEAINKEIFGDGGER